MKKHDVSSLRILGCGESFALALASPSPVPSPILSPSPGPSLHAEELTVLRVFVFSSSPVGEPLNDEAWLWYHNVVGKGKATVVDTWWQTGMYICTYCVQMI